MEKKKIWLTFECYCIFILAGLAVNAIPQGALIALLSYLLVLLPIHLYYFPPFIVHPRWLTGVLIAVCMVLGVNFLGTPALKDSQEESVTVVMGLLCYLTLVNWIAYEKRALSWLGMLLSLGTTLMVLYIITLQPSVDPNWKIVNPNVLAGAIVPGFFAIWLVPKVNLILIFIYWGLLSLSIILAHSYGALIAIIIVFLFFLCWRIARFLRWLSVIPFIVTIIFMLLLLPQLQPLVDKNQSLQVRFDIWDAAVKVIQEEPLMGVGLGRFEDVAVGRYISFYYGESIGYDHAHNLFLQFWADFGLIGGTMLAVFILAIIGIALKARVQQNHRTNTALLGMIGVIFIHNMVDVTLWMTKPSPLLWIVAAMVVGQSLVETVNRKQNGT